MRQKAEARGRGPAPLSGSTRQSGGSSAFTLVELMLVVTIIAIVAAVAVPSLVESRKSANECSAVSCLRTLSSTQMFYRVRSGSYGTLSDLVALRALDESWSDTQRSGYVFAATVTDGGSNWHASAIPSSPGFTGDRSFYVDASGVIRFREGAGTPDSTDLPIQ